MPEGSRIGGHLGIGHQRELDPRRVVDAQLLEAGLDPQRRFGEPVAGGPARVVAGAFRGGQLRFERLNLVPGHELRVERRDIGRRGPSPLRARLRPSGGQRRARRDEAHVSNPGRRGAGRPVAERGGRRRRTNDRADAVARRRHSRLDRFQLRTRRRRGVVEIGRDRRRRDRRSRAGILGRRLGARIRRSGRARARPRWGGRQARPQRPGRAQPRRRAPPAAARSRLGGAKPAVSGGGGSASKAPCCRMASTGSASNAPTGSSPETISPVIRASTSAGIIAKMRRTSHDSGPM